MLERPPVYRRNRPRRRTWPRVLAVTAAVVLAFALGVAFGKALGDGPEPDATVTYVRTLTPLPQQPATSP
jgi:energy-converting hydrogenase Eha subunit A